MSEDFHSRHRYRVSLHRNSLQGPLQLNHPLQGPPLAQLPPAVPGTIGTSGNVQVPRTQGNNDDDDDNGDDEDDEEEEEDDNDEEGDEEEEYDEEEEEDDDDEEGEEEEDPEDDGDEYEEVDDDEEYDPADYEDDYANNDPNRGQNRKCGDLVEEVKRRKTGESSIPLHEEDEPVERIVDVPREHEIEQIPEQEAPVDPQLVTPEQSCLQDTPPDTPLRRSPHIKHQEVSQQIAPTPISFVHSGTVCQAARTETPQNPSTKQNQHISRKLNLRTPSGTNPQPSTSTGGDNPKTVPVKGHPKTGGHGRGHGHRAPPTGGRGAPPTGGAGPGPGVGAGGAGLAAGGGGGGGPAAPHARNAQYIFRSPLLIEVEGKKVSWDHNMYSSKAFCELTCALAFVPQGHIVHVFPQRIDIVSASQNCNDMTIDCLAEHINIQKHDNNLLTQFDTLTSRLVEILVTQLMTTANIATMSFAEQQQLGLKYYSDATTPHGRACRNCYHCNGLNNIRTLNLMPGVAVAPYETLK